MMARLITKFCYSEFVGYYQDTLGNYFVIQNINIANKEVYIRPEMLSQDDDPNCSVFHRPHPASCEFVFDGFVSTSFNDFWLNF